MFDIQTLPLTPDKLIFVSGMIDKELFIAILTQLGEMKISEKEAISWIEILDRHKDGKLRINGKNLTP